MIPHAYQLATYDDSRAVKVKAHEVQKIGTSLLFRKNCVVQQVLKAWTWSLETTFSAFCLRDVTHRLMDTFSIEPVVAAQEVVHLTIAPMTTV